MRCFHSIAGNLPASRPQVFNRCRFWHGDVMKCKGVFNPLCPWVPEVHCKSWTASMSTVQKSSINHTQTKQGITQLLTNIQSLCNVSYLSTLLTGVYTPRNSQKYPKMKISEEHNKTLLRERIRNLWGMIQHRHYCGKIQCQLFLSIFSLSYSLISLFIEFKILSIIYSIRILPIFKKQLNRMCSISGQHEIIDAHWSDCLFVNNKPRVTLML